jgi:hypothetical protein
MSNTKHWIAFFVFWGFMGPLGIACVIGLLYCLYLLVREFTYVVLVFGGFGVFMGVTHWAGNYLDQRGFQPWKPKSPR